MKHLKYLILVLTTFVCLGVNAQALKKTVLGVEDFTYSNQFTPAQVSLVRNQIIEAIQKTGRVIVVDHNSSNDRILAKESERRKQESAMDANDVADMGTLNANCLLKVSLDQLTSGQKIYEEYEYRKGSDGKSQRVVTGRYPYYVAEISYSVTFINCENGSTLAHETFKYKDGSYSSYSHESEYPSAKAAEEGLLAHCVNENAFKVLILNTFKAQGKVISVDQGDAKKAKTIYVSLGSEDGIAKKQMLEVFKEIDLGGEKAKKLIGEVEVVEILSPSSCLCKVKKGGDLIQQSLSAGQNLPVKTREVKQSFWGGVK